MNDREALAQKMAMLIYEDPLYNEKDLQACKAFAWSLLDAIDADPEWMLVARPDIPRVNQGLAKTSIGVYDKRTHVVVEKTEHERLKLIVADATRHVGTTDECR